MNVIIENSNIIPKWDAENREYDVYLDVNSDLIKITYQALDNGQIVDLVSNPEFIQGDQNSRRLQGSGSGPPLDSVPLPIGGVQRSPSTLVSTIDTGHQRVLELTVRSADQSAHGTYKFKVKRPFCPPERRFFDGAARTCTDICNEGYFGDHATGRCTRCLQENCLVCDGGSVCTLCPSGSVVSGGTCAKAGPLGLGEVAEAGSSASPSLRRTR